MLVKKDNELHFDDLPFAEFLYDNKHPLTLLGDAINWDNLLNYLEQFYSKGMGRPTTPLRAQAGTLIIKRVKNLSDRECVKYVKDSIHAQRFCDLVPSKVANYMNPKTGLTNFRSKIGVDGMAFIDEVLLAAARKKPLFKGNKLIIDTTCVPIDIHYPTDIRLLERCRKEVVNLLKKAKKFGLDAAYRTWNRTARRLFIQFSKLSKPKEKTIKRTHKKMISFVKRNLRQLEDLRKNATAMLGKKASYDPFVYEFLLNLKNSEKRIRIILHQQRRIYQGILHIPGRIVSFHKDHIRPIVRGKFPVSTEFGPKVLTAVVKGYSYVINAFNSNVSDTTMVLSSLRWFKKTFGRLPIKLIADRGFFSRHNVNLLKSLLIFPGIQIKGKNPASSIAQRKCVRQRQIIESRISLLKRKFGWGRCLAKNSSHETAWIRSQTAAMNVHLAFFADSS